MSIRPVNVLRLAIPWVVVACAQAADAPSPQEVDEPQTAPYAVMYKFTSSDEERAAVSAQLDGFREEQGAYFLGEVYRTGALGEHVLVFTLRGGERSREVGIHVLGGTQGAPFWTGIIETGEGVFTVLEVADVDGDSVSDIVYCRWDDGQQRVEAALRDESGWRIELRPARVSCGAAAPDEG